MRFAWMSANPASNQLARMIAFPTFQGLTLGKSKSVHWSGGGLLPFLTAYDPLSSTNGSIDPLGSLQSYVSLADMLLPGVTTITTRSRYLSMLCAALSNAEAACAFDVGTSGLTQRRQAVQPYERLWALACVAAAQDGNARASDGLRGVTKTEARYKHYAARGQSIGLDFRILKFQERTGAVGTYWTAMIGGDLIDPDVGTLTTEGRDLAKAFPALPLSEKDRVRLADPVKALSVEIPIRDLIAWGRRVNLANANGPERLLLREALLSHERRDCLYRAFRALESANALPSDWHSESVKALREAVAAQKDAPALGLPDVLDAILHFERFHEAVLCVFETLLWWGTEHSNKRIAELIDDGEFQRRAKRCIATANWFWAYWEQSPNKSVRAAVKEFAGFANVVRACSDAGDVFDAVHARHGKIQSGKLDGGVPKREWISVKGSLLDRPLPRFQRTKKPVAARGKFMTHPYRLDPFIHMLRETGALHSARAA